MSWMPPDSSSLPQVSDAFRTGCLLVVVAVIMASAVWFARAFWPSSVVVEPPVEEQEEQQKEEQKTPAEGRYLSLIDRLAIDHLGKKSDLLDSDPHRT